MNRPLASAASINASLGSIRAFAVDNGLQVSILDGLISKTSTALIFVGPGPAFGSNHSVLKMTGRQFAPPLQRELAFLKLCQRAEIKSARG